MSRYEDAVRLAQVRQLVGERKYNKAAGLLRTINTKQIKSVADMRASAKAFSEVGQYTTAKELYLRLYKKEKDKLYLQQLVYVCIKSKEFDEAEKYYQQFTEVSRSRRDSLILHYRIRKAAGADVNELISILEELKSEEYLEEWAYELARMYQKAGRNEDCRKECENIKTWFGSGEVVERATVLLAYLTVDANLQSFPDKDYTIHEEPKNPADTMTIPPLNPEILKNQKKAEKERKRRRKEDREAFLIADAAEGFYEDEKQPLEEHEDAVLEESNPKRAEGTVSEEKEALKDSEVSEENETSEKEPDSENADSEEKTLLTGTEEAQPDEDKDTGQEQTETHDEKEKREEDHGAQGREPSPEDRKEEEALREDGNIPDDGRKEEDPEDSHESGDSAGEAFDEKTSGEEGEETRIRHDITGKDVEDDTLSFESSDDNLGNGSQFTNFPIKEQEKFIRESQSGTGITRNLAAEISTIMEMEKEGRLEVPGEEEDTSPGNEPADAPEGMKEIKENSEAEEEISDKNHEESGSKKLSEGEKMSNADKIMPEPDMPEKKQVEPKKKHGLFSVFRKSSDEEKSEKSDKAENTGKTGKAETGAAAGAAGSENVGEAPVTTRAIRKNIRDLLTLINGEPEPTNYVLIGTGDEKILGISKKIVRIMHRKKFISSARIALIKAEQLNDLDFDSVKGQLKGGCLLVADASQLLFSTINKIINLMDEYSGDFCVILSDEGDTLDGLFKLYPPLSSRFQYIIDVSSYGPEDYN